MASAWMHCVGVPDDVARETARAVSGAGVEIVGRAAVPAAAGGLLVVGDDEQAAIEALGRLGGDGSSRIVVLLATPDRSDGRLAWRLRAAGAADVLARDEPGAPAAIAARLGRWAALDGLIAAATSGGRLAGRSPAWIGALREVVEVAAFTSASVVLIGESGTGKEHLAQLVHALDRRADKGPLVTVDCTTVVPELSGSEFFGHERGAFTGAAGTRDGAFARADGGTLFLDEVGELPLGLQAQLLRVVQEGTYKRVGGNDWFRTRFRLICATHRDLQQEVAERRFRLDFYHRIGGCVVRIPPLRERTQDILVLARQFLAELLPAAAAAGLDPPLRQFLLQRGYPGNVRELKQLAGRLCAHHVGTGPFTIGDVPAFELGLPGARPDGELVRAAGQAALMGLGLKEIARRVREAAIREALAASQDNVQSASRLLRVTDRALQLERAKRDG